jgi:DAK2 domain fusion protein YloV
MSGLAALDAPRLRRAIETYRDALALHRVAINHLNVYPVPDGDTGTNMALTLESVAAELAVAGASMADVCGAIAHGSLMGARGNSGVILSQFLRGLTEQVEMCEAIDAPTLSNALVAAADAAYGAVMRPVEGTILTVVRDASNAARAAVVGGRAASVVAVVESALAAGRDSLARTPELLSVLKDAGVVDAGGSGLLLLFDSLLHALDGRPLPQPVDTGPVVGTAMATAEHGDGTRYEVMFLLDLDDASIDGFKSSWDALGDSIVVVGGRGMWNCHIHTDDIGGSIEAAIELGGRPSKIRVTDLREAVEEQHWVRDAGDVTPLAPPLEPVATGVVAVGVGAGIARIFRSLGVQVVVTGGQTMNPSTADLLDAVARVTADSVVILPNNKNIVPVAGRVGELCDRPVGVVPTRTVAEGFAALVAYDPEASLDENVAAMGGAAEHIVAGEVTRAVRDATSPIGAIHRGDFLGIARHGIAAVDGSLAGATTKLLATLLTDDHELVTLIAGEDATPADTAAIESWLAQHHPDVTAEVHHGGQPLYPYYVGVE